MLPCGCFYVSLASVCCVCALVFVLFLCGYMMIFHSGGLSASIPAFDCMYADRLLDARRLQTSVEDVVGLLSLLGFIDRMVQCL